MTRKRNSLIAVFIAATFLLAGVATP